MATKYWVFQNLELTNPIYASSRQLDRAHLQLLILTRTRNLLARGFEQGILVAMSLADLAVVMFNGCFVGVSSTRWAKRSAKPCARNQRLGQVQTIIVLENFGEIWHNAVRRPSRYQPETLSNHQYGPQSTCREPLRKSPTLKPGSASTQLLH